MNLQINLLFTPSWQHQLTGEWEGSATGGFKMSLQIYFGVQRSNLEEIKLSFCFEICRENILLFKVFSLELITV